MRGDVFRRAVWKTVVAARRAKNRRQSRREGGSARRMRHGRRDRLDGEVTPSPVFAGGTLFIVSPSNKLQAIRPDGQGDVTKTHLGWMAEDGIPDITSPVSNGELVFVIDTGGMLTCYDAKDG